jgi:hypothetical protein
MQELVALPVPDAGVRLPLRAVHGRRAAVRRPWLAPSGLQTPPVTREVLRDFFDITLKHQSPN